MNYILVQYFERLRSVAAGNEISYAVYERDSSFSMPFSIHMRFPDPGGFTRDSWGSGQNKDEAFGKALMEMIERIYFSGFSPFSFKNVFGFRSKPISLQGISARYSLPISFLHPSNTNGVAIHLNKSKAIKSALLELIERHVVLCCLVNRLGPDFKVKLDLAREKNGTFYVWKGPLKTFTVVGAISDGRGCYFSSGCDYVLEQALLKAKLELNAFLFLKDKHDEDFRIVPDDIQSFNRYHKYSGDRSIIEFFEKTRPGIIPELCKKGFHYCDIPLPWYFTGLQVLPCVRVVHPDVQQLFFDNWGHKYLNPRIFSKDQILPSFPHIIA